MQRREFLALIEALTWPSRASAQQTERMRRVGVLMAHAETDPEFQDYLAAFRGNLPRAQTARGAEARQLG